MMTCSDDEEFPGMKKLDVLSRQLSTIRDRLESVEKRQGKFQAELSDLQASEPKAAPTVDDQKAAYLEILIEQWAEKNNARLEELSSKLMTTKEELGGRIKSLENFGQAFFEKAMEEKKERKMFEAKVQQRFMEELDPSDADCNPEDVSKQEEQPPPELVGKEREAREAQYAALCERLERIERDAGKLSEQLEENKRDLEKTGEEHEAKVAEVGTVVRRLSQNMDGHRASIEDIIDKTKERHGQAIGQVQEKLNKTLTQIERLEKVERLAQNLKSDLSSEKRDRESLEARLGRELREIPSTIDSVQLEVRELGERVKSIGESCTDLQDNCDPDVMKRRFDKLQDRIDYLEKQGGSTQAKLHDLQAEGGCKNALSSMDDGKISYLEALIEQWAETNTAALDEVKAKVFEEHRSNGKQSERMESLEQLGKQMYTSMSGEKIAREQFQQRLEERMSSLEEHLGESLDGETTRGFTRSLEWERRLDRMERQFCEQLHELASMGSPSSQPDLQDHKSPIANHTQAERRFSQLGQFVAQSVDGHRRMLTDLKVVFASLKEKLQSLSLSSETLHAARTLAMHSTKAVVVYLAMVHVARRDIQRSALLNRRLCSMRSTSPTVLLHQWRPLLFGLQVAVSAVGEFPL